MLGCLATVPSLHPFVSREKCTCLYILDFPSSACLVAFIRKFCLDSNPGLPCLTVSLFSLLLFPFHHTPGWACSRLRTFCSACLPSRPILWLSIRVCCIQAGCDEGPCPVPEEELESLARKAWKGGYHPLYWAVSGLSSQRCPSSSCDIYLLLFLGRLAADFLCCLCSNTYSSSPHLHALPHFFPLRTYGTLPPPASCVFTRQR